MNIKIAEIKRNIINIVLHINPRIQREGEFLTITCPKICTMYIHYKKSFNAN